MTRNIPLAVAMIGSLFTGLIGQEQVFSLNPNEILRLPYKKTKHIVLLSAEVELNQYGKVEKVIRILPLKAKMEEIEKTIHRMVKSEIERLAEKENKSLEELIQEGDIGKNIMQSFAKGALKIGEGVFLTAYVAGKYVLIPLTAKTIKLFGKAKNAICKLYDKRYVPGGNAENPIIID